MDQDPFKTIADLHKILDISRAMVAAGELEDLLWLIVNRGMELLRAERATVFLYDQEANQLVSRNAAGEGELRVPADKGLVGAAAQTMQTIRVDDAYSDARFNPDVDRRTGFRTRNLLTVPLPDYEGGLVGVLQVLNKSRGPFTDYDVTLAQALAAQAGVAIQRHRLIGHYIVKQQMDRAMAIAREIQQALLPKENPTVEGFDVAGFYAPADQTGGDIYDFLTLPDGRLMIAVADATGHGIGPAMVIAETRAILRAIALQDATVSQALATLNNLLAADLAEARFVTCFLGLLDAPAATLTFASAGHGPMLFYDREADSFKAVPATALPLAVMEGVDYDIVIHHRFSPGDFAVVTTDGFFEAANAAGADFGIERMQNVLRSCRDLGSQEMIAALCDAVRAFTAGTPQGDDLTAVVIRKL